MKPIINIAPLMLRPFNVEDAKVLSQISNQENVLRWMPDWQNDLEQTITLIEWVNSQFSLATSTYAKVAFALTLEGKVIGFVGIGNKEELDDEIEICYFLSDDFLCKGYVTKAVVAVASWAFETLKIPYLVAIVQPENVASKRVLEKSGFNLVCTRQIKNEGEEKEKPFLYYKKENPLL